MSSLQNNNIQTNVFNKRSFEPDYGNFGYLKKGTKFTFTIGVMNSIKKDGTFSKDGQKVWMKLIKRPLICEPS